MVVAQLILILIAAYAVVGIVFAVPFVSYGAVQIDPNAKNAPVGFRLVIVPGSAALWPFLAYRWIQAVKAERDS